MNLSLGNRRGWKVGCALSTSLLALLCIERPSSAGFWSSCNEDECFYDFAAEGIDFGTGSGRPAKGVVTTIDISVKNPAGLSDIMFSINVSSETGWSELVWTDFPDNQWFLIGGGAGFLYDPVFSGPFDDFYLPKFGFPTPYPLVGAGVMYNPKSTSALLRLRVFAGGWDVCPRDQSGHLILSGSGMPPMPAGTLFCTASLAGEGLSANFSAIAFGDNRGTFSFSIARVSQYQIVPEPATWAMMIAGFGLVGAAARRRRVRTPAIGHGELLALPAA